jgi:hypothetical protein
MAWAASCAEGKNAFPAVSSGSFSEHDCRQG